MRILVLEDEALLAEQLKRKLLQRGFSAGVTIYAPSIILSSALGWPLNLTNVVVGVIVIVYTVSGGTRAVRPE